MSVFEAMVSVLDGLAAHPGAGRGAAQICRELCVAAVTVLGADGAVVMEDIAGDARSVWAHPAGARLISQAQEVAQPGPNHDAITTTAPVHATSREVIDRRWPGFSAAAGSAGIQSLMVVPLVNRGRSWGTLGLYWFSPAQPTAEVAVAARLLAHNGVAHLEAATDRDDAHDEATDLRHQVLHDQLTGLPNRGLVHELLTHSLQVAHRRGTSVAVLFLDLDGFKAVNDSRGHATGDAVLVETARRLRASIRGSDTVGRLSGDEFLVICDDLPAAADDIVTATTVLADRVRAAVAAPITVDGGGVTVAVTASIGVAIAEQVVSAVDLIHEADLAMYEAKALGPGGTIIHKSAAQTDLDRTRRVERGLFEALRQDEFEVFYQPVYTAGSVLVAVEALVRWHHPCDGLLAAGAFIDVAESSGVIVPLGQWLRTQALTQLRRWLDTTPDAAPQVVWCNLSPRELAAPDMATSIAEALTASGLTTGHLGIEVVEAHLADTQLISTLTALHAAGHPLAIDDFGTGYSSLSRLVELPFTHLKIDRSLVAGLPDDTRSQTLIRAVLTIAADLHTTVISEGVENADQAEYLAAAGSHLFQGYHYHRPATAGRITALLTGGSAPQHHLVRGTTGLRPPAADLAEQPASDMPPGTDTTETPGD